ncbi:unnamed protein product, partial [Bubo scandiacus]
LTVSLEEKELSLKTLEENNLAQHNKVSQLLSALHQAEQLHSDHRREIQELNNQVQSLQEAALEEEAGLAAREEQLLWDLEESQAGERCSRNSLRVLEAEVSELHLRLCSTESRAQALVTGCQQDSELELSKRQAEKEYFSACNQELQKQLAQSQEETQMAERKKCSLQSALQEEAAALKETVTLHQEVASLEMKLETTEKQRKDVL